MSECRGFNISLHEFESTEFNFRLAYSPALRLWHRRLMFDVCFREWRQSYDLRQRASARRLHPNTRNQPTFQIYRKHNEWSELNGSTNIRKCLIDSEEDMIMAKCSCTVWNLLSNVKSLFLISWRVVYFVQPELQDYSEPYKVSLYWLCWLDHFRLSESSHGFCVEKVKKIIKICHFLK